MAYRSRKIDRLLGKAREGSVIRVSFDYSGSGESEVYSTVTVTNAERKKSVTDYVYYLRPAVTQVNGARNSSLREAALLRDEIERKCKEKGLIPEFSF